MYTPNIPILNTFNNDVLRKCVHHIVSDGHVFVVGFVLYRCTLKGIEKTIDVHSIWHSILPGQCSELLFSDRQ